MLVSSSYNNEECSYLFSTCCWFNILPESGDTKWGCSSLRTSEVQRRVYVLLTSEVECIVCIFNYTRVYSVVIKAMLLGALGVGETCIEPSGIRSEEGCQGLECERQCWRANGQGQPRQRNPRYEDLDLKKWGASWGVGDEFPAIEGLWGCGWKEHRGEGTQKTLNALSGFFAGPKVSDNAAHRVPAAW